MAIKRELKDLQGEVRKHEREVRSLQDEKRRADERAAQAEAAHKSEIARHHAAAAALDERAAEMARFAQVQRELEQELDAQRARYTELAEARRKESDARHVRRLALEAFNRSEHVERVVAISRSLGDPIVNVHCDGLELPRPVKVTITWDISWYEYIVRLDLLERTVTVEETRRGDDPRELPAAQLRAERRAAGRPDRARDAGLRRRAERRRRPLGDYRRRFRFAPPGPAPDFAAGAGFGFASPAGGVVHTALPVCARITASSASSSAVRRNSAAVGSTSESVIASSSPRRPYSATAWGESCECGPCGPRAGARSRIATRGRSGRSACAHLTDRPATPRAAPGARSGQPTSGS